MPHTNIDAKLDKILESIASKTSTEKPETQEEKDEKELKKLDQEIEEIVSLIITKETRKTNQEKIHHFKNAININKNESHPYLRVNHTNKKSGKQMAIQRRTSHMMELGDAYHMKRDLHKYPEDLNHILNVKLQQRNDLLEKILGETV